MSPGVTGDDSDGNTFSTIAQFLKFDCCDISDTEPITASRFQVRGRLPVSDYWAQASKQLRSAVGVGALHLDFPSRMYLPRFRAGLSFCGTGTNPQTLESPSLPLSPMESFRVECLSNTLNDGA